MILTCPSCGTQYVVKDGAIPPEGRQVRCASCKHSWHQDPEQSAEATEESQAVEQRPEVVEEPAAETAQQEESLTEATIIEPRSGPELEERAYEEAVVGDQADELRPDFRESLGGTYQNAQFDITKRDQAETVASPDWREPPVAESEDDEFTPFPTADGEAPRRRSPALRLIVIVLIIIALAAAFWFLAPASLKAQLGIGAAGATPLALVTTHMDRQRLESGNELLTVTGRVINPTGKEQQVPPLQAQLKTKTGKVVYTWTIAPPARSLAAGASASFNSAEVNVPPGGDELTITLGAQVG